MIKWLRITNCGFVWLFYDNNFSCKKKWEFYTFSVLFGNCFFMKIFTDFSDNELIPSLYTCDGEGRFPTLKIEDIPITTKTLALIVDDSDAPAWIRDHLLLANIPLTEDPYVIISQNNFDIAIFGQNSRGELARWAPCPPSGTHRYIFKIYALSEKLEISSWFSKERLIELMWGKILGQAELVWLYKRG